MADVSHKYMDMFDDFHLTVYNQQGKSAYMYFDNSEIFILLQVMMFRFTFQKCIDNNFLIKIQDN